MELNIEYQHILIFILHVHNYKVFNFAHNQQSVDKYYKSAIIKE